MRATIDLFKKPFVDWPISVRGNSTRTSGNSLTSLEVQSKDLEAASLRLLDQYRFLGNCSPTPPLSQH